MSRRTMVHEYETFPIRGVFRISRGTKTLVQALSVQIVEGDVVGRGECIPYSRYGESIESVRIQLDEISAAVADGLTIEELQSALPAGSARNAVDCALWDLRSRLTGRSIADYAGLSMPLRPVTTAFTLSLDDPAVMGEMAHAHAHLPLLKLKLGGDGDLERVRTVREAAPNARLMADANESWQPAHLDLFLPEFARLGVELLEQPLASEYDEILRDYDSPVPLAADESCRDLSSVEEIAGKYRFANIKLDKTGGLTEALLLASAARDAGLSVMIGCMVASSLSMAPGIVVAQTADIVHLDGPMLLSRDRSPALTYTGASVSPDVAVWSV
jgi:L-alanine-DL-glutamate epimerase-like enolase superfamily enzyme